jgi:PAS domain S-box-containing protein
MYELKFSLPSAIMGLVSEGVTIVDSLGRILMVNRAVLEMTGYSEEEVLGEPALSFLKKGDRIEILFKLRKVLTGDMEMASFQATLVAKDGREIPVGVSARRVEGENPLIVMVFRDLTEMRRFQTSTLELLKKRIEQYRSKPPIVSEYEEMLAPVRKAPKYTSRRAELSGGEVEELRT